MDCKCKGVYIGKSKDNECGFAIFQQREERNKIRRGRRRKGKKRSGIGGHVDLFSEECKIWDSVG